MTKIFDALAKDNGNPTKTNKLSNKEAKQPLNCTPRASGTRRMSTRRCTDTLAGGLTDALTAVVIFTFRTLSPASRS